MATIIGSYPIVVMQVNSIKEAYAKLLNYNQLFDFPGAQLYVCGVFRDVRLRELALCTSGWYTVFPDRSRSHLVINIDNVPVLCELTEYLFDIRIEVIA